MATDAAGNIYMSGRFSHTTSFGNLLLTSNAGSDDMFLTKINPSGTVEWAVKGGGPNTEEGNDVAIDAEGNIYVTGTFGLSATFNGIQLPYRWSQDIFVAKYNPVGELIWIKAAGGNGPDISRTIALANGYCYIGGEYSSKFYIGADTLLNGGKFIARYTTDGDLQWARRLPGTGTNYLFDLATDLNGNCIATGYFGTTSQFGATTLTGGGMFIAKYDSAGTVLWAHKAGSSPNTLGYGVGTDSQGNSYVAGRYSGSAAFGSVALPHASSADLFVAKYDASGSLQWVTTGGSHDYDHIRDIAVDEAGNSYIIGNFTGTATFGNTSAHGATTYDVFLVSYDTSGNERWVLSATGPYSNNGITVVADNSGSCYLAGTYRNSISLGGTTLTNNDYASLFLAKLSTITGLPEDAIAAPDLYPNPFTTSFTVSLSGTEPVKAALTDMLGREVHRQEIAPEAGSTTATITPPANLPAGVYVLQLQQGNSIKKVRVVRQ